jgi:hypothetical protein
MAAPIHGATLQQMEKKATYEWRGGKKVKVKPPPKDNSGKGDGHKQMDTRGTCYSGRDCSGDVVSHPHHKHNCCGGRGSSGTSFRDSFGVCSNC